ncbi:hypothetical protein FRB91_001544 [Serendipita sp. 411]|nr:hypothetical protein FRB91_001544 [Serendipita sp. 411]
MTTPKQIDEQCLQLLNELTKTIKTDMDITPYGYIRSSKEKEYRRNIADKRRALIQDTASSLLSQLSTDRNAYAPISVLVDELLIEIWSYISTEDLFSVSAVCQRWRRVSLDAAKLWTEIHFDKHQRARIELLLDRAKNSPLEISMNSMRPMTPMVSWSYQLQLRRMQVQQRESQGRGWCESGAVYNGYYPPHPLRPTMRQPFLRQLDDEDEEYDCLGPVYSQKPSYTLPSSRFNQIVQRAKSLRAIFGAGPSSYVTNKTLTLPMPYLRRLSLFKGPGGPGMHPSMMHPFRTTFPPGSSGNNKENQTKLATWFGGSTPYLKELDLSCIHAPWNDPIYSKLTHLRINVPDTRAKISELLRILRRCPDMEYLDLSEVIARRLAVVDEDEQGIYDTDKKQLPVELNKLWYLHVQESGPGAIVSDLLSVITCPRLETLVICSSTQSALTNGARVTDNSGGSPKDDEDGPRTGFDSFRSLFSKTTQLQFTQNNLISISIIGRVGESRIPHKVRWVHQGDTIKKIPGIGWSFSFTTYRAMVIVPPYTTPAPGGFNFGAAYQPSILNPRKNRIQLLNELDIAGVCYHRIEKIDFGGTMDYDDKFYEALFSQCFNLKHLRLRFHGPGLGHTGIPSAQPPPPGLLGQTTPNQPTANRKTAMDILDDVIADRLCLQLEEVHLSWFSSPANHLAAWVERRALSGFRLKKVVVDVYEPIPTNPPGHQLPPTGSASSSVLDKMGAESSILDENSRLRIEAALEKNEDSQKSGLVWGNSERESTLKVHNFYKNRYGRDEDDGNDVVMEG